MCIPLQHADPHATLSAQIDPTSSIVVRTSGFTIEVEAGADVKIAAEVAAELGTVCAGCGMAFQGPQPVDKGKSKPGVTKGEGLPLSQQAQLCITPARLGSHIREQV